MAVNIYDQPFQAQYMNTYTPMPYQEILQAGSAMQGRYDTAEAIRDDLTTKMLDIKGLDADKQLKNQLIGEYETSINEKLNEVGNDYGQLLPFIKQQQRKFQDDYQRGQLGQIESNYNKFMTGYQEAKDRMTKGDISKEEFNATFGPGGETLAQYTGVGDRGDLQEIQIRDLVDQNNYQEIAIDIADKLEGQKTEVLGQWLRGQGLSDRDLPPNYLQALDRSTDILKHDDIYNVVSFAIQKNPMYQAHIQQRQDLLSGQMERDLSGIDKDFVDYYLQDGLMGDDDIEAMESQGLNSNNRDDKVEYFKDKYRQGILDNLVGDNARLAGTMFQKANVNYTRNIRKDDLLTEKMKNQQNILDSTYISTTLGEIEIKDTDAFKASISENTQAIGEKMTSVSKLINNTGLVMPKGARQEDFVNAFISKMKSPGGRDAFINLTITTGKNKGIEIDPEEAGENVDFAYQQAQSALLSNIGLKQQQALLNSAREKVINDIDWEDEWKEKEEFNKKMTDTGNIIGGNTIVTGEQLNSIYNSLNINSGESLKDFVNQFNTQEELSNAISNFKTDFNFPEINQITSDLSKIWGNLNEKTDTQLETGIVSFNTKVDFAVGEKKSPEMTEITTAKNAFANPRTRIIVPGVGETTLTNLFANNPEVGEYMGGKVVANLIMDRGKPYYQVTAYDNKTGESKKSMTFLAEIPGREAPVLEFMETNTQNKTEAVAKMAKAYVGANYMGDFWNPDNLLLMKKGSEVSVPLYLKDGTKLGDVTRDKERGYKLMYIDKLYKKGEKPKAKYFINPIDIAMEIYETVNLYKKS